MANSVSVFLKRALFSVLEHGSCWETDVLWQAPNRLGRPLFRLPRVAPQNEAVQLPQTGTPIHTAQYNNINQNKWEPEDVRVRTWCRWR